MHNLEIHGELALGRRPPSPAIQSSRSTRRSAAMRDVALRDPLESILRRQDLRAVA